MEFSAKQIAEYIQGIIVGDENATVHTFAKIEEGVPGALSFLSNPKYTHYIYDTKSSIVLVNKDFEPEHELQTTLIKVDNAYESLAKLMALYEMSISKKQGVSPLASIAESAKIGKNVYIGPFTCIEDGAEIGDNVCIHPQATIGSNVKIGMNTIIYPHVTIYQDCRIGNNCILHAGAVIGADGFGFAPGADGYEKIPQIGIVELEDNVEIGANTCIDRATMGHTLIKQGVKLDNLIQVAHNVEIGKHTVMASQVGIAGSAKIGEWCMFGGQVGVAGHIKVGDHVNVGAQSGIPGNTKSNTTLMGYPAIDPKQFARSAAIYKKLPDMYVELGRLQKEIEELKISQEFDKFISSLYSKAWIVYCKPPFKNANSVIEYLGRYTHRVAISNSRILNIDNGKVTFKWRDYRDKNKMKTMVLDAEEFIRRFILHILPPRFMKIRHFGLLGNRNKTKKLTLCKSLTNTKVLTKENISPLEILKKVSGKDFNLCPICGIGHLIRPSPA